MTKLYEDALRLSVNENLRNIRTLLEWAQGAGGLDETIRHTRQALTLLSEVVDNLEELKRS